MCYRMLQALWGGQITIFSEYLKIWPNRTPTPVTWFGTYIIRALNPTSKW